MIEYLSNQKLEDVLTDELTIVDFFANWCSPCKMIGMELEELPNKIIKVDVDTHGELAQSHGVMSIPTVEIYKNKKMVTHFVGFKTKEERNLFLKLISVKGLGCKMALPMFATGSIEGIKDAIERENILYLKKFPKIGDKVARQIILDLKGKLDLTKISANSNKEELVETLKALGYKQMDITKILPQIKSDTIEEQIKEALKLFLK